jgi:hypothetical protein
VAAMLLERLRSLAPQDDRYDAILRYLLTLNKAVSIEAQNEALKYLVHISTGAEEIQRRLILALASSTANSYWWPQVWNLLRSNREFAESIIGIIADRHSSPYLHILIEPQLYELYLLVVDIYRFEDDIVFRSGTVPKRHDQQRWRDGILNELASRGTRQSLELLRQLYSTIPQIPDIRNLIEKATERFRVESWVAPKPENIRQLLADRTKRFPRNADQLLDLVIEILVDIEEAYRGSAVMKNSLWNQQGNSSENLFRPGDEFALSDALAEWLRDRLNRIVINREAQVRMASHSDERTDIQIEMFNDSDELLMVIIEVKGCWYADIWGRIQSQLVNEYLANNTRCSHGIYLIGYFSSTNWDTSDYRFDLCGRNDKQSLSDQLKELANKVESPKPIVVKTFVFDASFS